MKETFINCSWHCIFLIKCVLEICWKSGIYSKGYLCFSYIFWNLVTILIVRLSLHVLHLLEFFTRINIEFGKLLPGGYEHPGCMIRLLLRLFKDKRKFDEVRIIITYYYYLLYSINFQNTTEALWLYSVNALNRV